MFYFIYKMPVGTQERILDYVEQNERIGFTMKLQHGYRYIFTNE